MNVKISNYSVMELNNGNLLFANTTGNNGQGGRDFAQFFATSAGYYIVNPTYGSAVDDNVYSFNRCTDNGFILCGTTEGFNARGTDVYLVKTDSTGNTLPIDILEISKSSENILIYPNPVSSSDLIIRLPELHKESEIIISEITGRIVNRIPIPSQHSMEVSFEIDELAVGMYFVTVRNQEEILGQSKFLRSR